jgi:predicted membrane protein
MNSSQLGVDEAIMGFLSEEVEALPICTDEESFERGSAFDDLELCVRSRAFRGGRVTAVMCGVTVDLRDAVLSPEGATISVQSAMSGIEIIVPREWDVVCDVQAVWGGVDGKRFAPAPREGAPRLRLTGMVVAGGLCVR